jgi:hypothetical protein
MSLLPVRPGRLKEPAFLEAFREYIASELLEFITNPNRGGYGESRARTNRVFDRFEREGQLPLADVQIRDLFIRLCQDIRLSPDEIDELLEKWFS